MARDLDAIRDDFQAHIAALREELARTVRLLDDAEEAIVVLNNLPGRLEHVPPRPTESLDRDTIEHRPGRRSER